MITKRINIKKLTIIISVSSFIFIFDQITKLIIRSQIMIGHSVPESGFFRLTHVRNTGSAFSLIKDQNILLTSIGILVLIVLIFFIKEIKNNQPYVIIAISMQIGGALGNLIDRIFLGSVVDFIDIGVSGVYRWPTFNIADSSIITGMALLILSFFLLKTNENKNTIFEKESKSNNIN